MKKKILIDKKDLLSAFKILEELRGSLDYIGAIGSRPEKHAEEAMKEALKEYFTSGVYKRIVDGASALDKYISEYAYLALSRSMKSYQPDVRKILSSIKKKEDGK